MGALSVAFGLSVNFIQIVLVNREQTINMRRGNGDRGSRAVKPG